ncbi:hypothetical protein [Octadecabacter antarcticus]|nr:hypothetical protein [Octadecabacter antarcticus]
MVSEPPIGRDEASAIVGHTIDTATWIKIRVAFHKHGREARRLQGSKTSRKKDDPQGWLVRQTAASKALETALKKINDVRTKHGEFLFEASENYSLKEFGVSASLEFNARAKLDRAFAEGNRALLIIERATERKIEVLTAASARDVLLCDIADALDEVDIPTGTTSGWALDSIDGQPGISDLTPFENLIDALAIMNDKDIKSFSAQIRAALSGRLHN